MSVAITRILSTAPTSFFSIDDTIFIFKARVNKITVINTGQLRFSGWRMIEKKRATIFQL
jgi:hypothetical protein